MSTRNIFFALKEQFLLFSHICISLANLFPIEYNIVIWTTRSNFSLPLGLTDTIVARFLLLTN